MLVKELIEQLQKINPEAVVTVDGYEGGNFVLKNIEVGFLFDNPKYRDPNNWDGPVYFVSEPSTILNQQAVNLTRYQYDLQ